MKLESILSYTIAGMSIQDLSIAFGIFFLSIIFSSLFSAIIIKILNALTNKTKSQIDDKILAICKSPLQVAIVLLGFYIAKEYLKVEKFGVFIDNIIRSFIVFIIFWILYKFVNHFTHIFKKFSSRFGKELGEDIENFIVKTLKLLLIIIAAMTILQGWGINISAFVASLGLVGMAFALAAKDTAANLFGSLVIFTDRPFKIGDWIKTPDVEGVIEDIGIRSTKVRTFAQALVNIPNAVVANSAITNWSKMGKRRISTRIGLTYSTSASQMQNILNDIREMLSTHEDIHKDTIMIYFDEFQDSALSIFCYFFTKTTKWGEFLKVRENVNLKIMQIIEKNNASFAFPSQSLYIESMPKN